MRRLGWILNEKFAGVYLTVLKETSFEEAKKIADRVLAEPENHDMTLVTYVADVGVASLNDDDGAEAIERSKRMAHILEGVMQQQVQVPR